MANQLPIRRTIAAGEKFCVVNCSWFVVQNLNTTTSMYIRNLMNDADDNSTEVKPGVSYNEPGTNSPVMGFAQVIFDGTELSGDGFTVTAVGTIQNTPYATAAELANDGLL